MLIGWQAFRRVRVVRTLTWAALALLPSSCISSLNPCDVRQVSDLVSPSGNLKAVVVHKDCGATTRKSVGVAIVRNDPSAVSDSTNTVFVIDDSTVFLVDDSTAGIRAVKTLSVSTRWDTDTALVILYDSAARVFVMRPKYLGIRVTYSPTTDRSQ